MYSVRTNRGKIVRAAAATATPVSVRVVIIIIHATTTTTTTIVVALPRHRVIMIFRCNALTLAR